jgi:tetratricopeptide (TPR) repeat protein
VDKLKKQESQATQPDQLMNCAREIILEVGDAKWAKEVFAKAIAATADFINPVDYMGQISQMVLEDLKDPVWADEIMDRCLKNPKLETVEKFDIAYFYSQSSDPSNFHTKSISIYKDILKANHKNIEPEQFYQAADVIFNDLNDKDLTVKFLEQAAKLSKGAWDLVFIAQRYVELLEDKKTAQKFVDLAIKACEDADEVESIEQQVKEFM